MCRRDPCTGQGPRPSAAPALSRGRPIRWRPRSATNSGGGARPSASQRRSGSGDPSGCPSRFVGRPACSAAAAALLDLSAVEALDEARGDARADEMGDVAAEHPDLFHKTRGDELKAVGGHQEHGLDPRIEPGVHAGHLKFVFEIRYGAQATHDDAGLDRLGKAHQQARERPHLDPLGGVGLAEKGDLLAHNRNALVGREQRALPVIPGNPDDEAVDDMQCPADDVGVAVGDRVEGAGIDPDAAAHHSSPSGASSETAAPGGMPGSPVPGPWGSWPLGSPPLDPSPFSSATSGRRATETTRSSSSTRKTTTPALPRRAIRISWTGMRITVPASVTSMIWSLWPTGNTATMASRRRLRSILLAPCPPRPVMR